MSKSTKLKAKLKRLKEKRAKKDAARAQYQAWAEQGINSKSKRATKKLVGRKTIRMRKHKYGICGNVGCVKCSPVAQKLAKEKQELKNA